MLFTPRRGLITLCTIAVAGAVTASALSFSEASGQPDAVRPSGCPHKPLAVPPSAPSSFAAAAKAVHAQIPQVFKGLRSQGASAWHHAEMTALVSTYGVPVNPVFRSPSGIAHFKKIAEQACGRAVASASLVAFLYFPACQIPCASDFAYVTRTRRGWRLWVVPPR